LLRKKVEADLQGKATDKDTVLAAVVRLIDETRMRIGNEEYAKENKSFGATTLRNRHAKVTRGKLKISYTGKHGVKRTVTITDRNLLRIAKRTQDLPGQHLFEYVDDNGEIRPVTSSDVNAYIKDAMGDDFTAKDFRTWGASVIAFETMAEKIADGGTVKLKSVMEPVAEALGNTPAISRKSYVHPALIEAAKDAGAIGSGKFPRAGKFLSGAERGLIEFLEALPEEKAKVTAKVERRAATKGKSKGAAEAEVAAEAKAKLESEAA
jgi:DNA topoisomerase-1